jgi:outer membrane protein TolC
LLVLAAVLGGPGWSAAQDPAGVLTLDRAIALAIASNREARVARLDEARADDDLEALRTERFPRFELKLVEGGVLAPLAFSFRQGAFGTFPATGPIPFEDMTVDSPRNLSTGVLFTAVQPLTQLGTIAVGEKLLALDRDLTAEKSRGVRLALVADVKRAYYGLQQVGAGLQAAREALGQLEELDRVVRGYVEREVVLAGDHLAVRTERARVDQAMLVLRHLESTLKERINALIGRALDTPFTIADEFPAAPPAYRLDEAVARARAARPALREAALRVQQAEEDVRLTERKRIPEVGVAFSFARLFNVEVLPPTFAAVGLVANWEPFDWGRRRLERAAKARTLEQARLGLQEAEALVTLDVNAKFRAALEAQSALTVADLARETAAERLRVATDRYRVESALLTDVLEAQTALARTTQEYQEALAAFWTARADLEEAIGDEGR